MSKTWRTAGLSMAVTTLVLTMPAGATTSYPGSTWPTYHRAVNRFGDAGSSVPALTGTLHAAWSRTLDGAVYAEPVLVGTRAIVGTENDSVYAINVTTGTIAWRHHLATPITSSALPCGDVSPLGITGAPAYDQNTGSVYLVGENSVASHTLYALSATTGALRWSRNLDLGRRNRYAQQERAAVLVAAGRVIVAFGGLYGDCGNYVGYVTSTPVTGSGATYVYSVPTAREGGIWAAPGPVLGPNGEVYVAVGNGAATSGSFDGSDSVTELSPTTMKRLAIFAPTTWASDNANDLDLGSSAPVPIDNRIVIAGKRGVAYLLAPTLSGSHQVGYQVASRSGCSAYGGAAARGTTVYLPCSGGVRALHVSSGAINWGWQASVAGSPVLAGGVVYVVSTSSSKFYELSLSTGQVLRSVAVPAVPHFATPTVADGGHLVLVGTKSGVVAIG